MFTLSFVYTNTHGRRYSFGIVLWELTTRKTPWVDELPSDHAEFFEGLNNALQSGRRPAIPDTVRAVHGAFVEVMVRCWAGDPANRPSFSEGARELAVCLRSDPQMHTKRTRSVLA
jgi:hypothetical protein